MARQLFLNILFKIIRDESPDYLVIAMDSKSKTFRHELFDDYKANRPKIYSHQSKLEEACLALLREHINGTLKFIGDHKKVFIFHILESTTLDYDTTRKLLR